MCLSLFYNSENSYLFVNDVEIYKFNAKGYYINVVPLCLCDNTKYFSTYNINFFNFNDILDIHYYLMKKKRYKIMYGLIKKCFLDY